MADNNLNESVKNNTKDKPSRVSENYPEIIPPIVNDWLPEKVKVNHANIMYVLRTFKKIMEGKGFHWWIDFGTLLGAYRNRKIIAWDHDADLCYLEEHKHIIKSCEEEFKKHGIVLSIGRYKLWYRGSYVDIEPCRIIGKKVYRECDKMPSERNFFFHLFFTLFYDFPVAWIYPLWKINLNGEYFPCPNHTKRFLKFRYLTFRISSHIVLPRIKPYRYFFRKESWKDFCYHMIFGCNPDIIKDNSR